jgi:4-hydroxymandelate oxidase
MDLGEIYTRGKEILLGQKIGFTLGAVETGWVMENNRRVLNSYALRQKSIDAPSAAATDVTVLGRNLKTPVIMSAMTMPIPAIRENGLLMVAQGLKEAGSMMWTGTPVPQNLRELADTGVGIIQNVKPFEDRNKLFQELEEIQAAGVTWVGVEIDSGQGTKIKDQTMASNCRPLSMAELHQIRKAVTKPLVLKGVLSGYDAARSIEAGADAIMVSNHGAHTIDYLPHPFQVMDEIRNVADGRIPVFVDSGFRRGSDVLKGLAFGADLVGLGRPILYGLAADGADGVRDVVQHITNELKRIMIMVGANSVEQVSRHCVIKV